MTFRVNRRKVIGTFIPVFMLVGLNLLSVSFKVYRWQFQNKPFNYDIYFLIAYFVLTIWLVWYFRNFIHRKIEVTDTEIKQVDRAGRILKSRRFDEIAELKLGESLSSPRSHRMIFADGKEWLVPGHSENFYKLICLIEERSDKSFEEPIASR